MAKMLEDLLEEDSLRDEPAANQTRCSCGRFAELISAPRTTAMGGHEWLVRCQEHGENWVS